MIENIKNGVTVISSMIAAIAMRGTLWSIVVWIAYHPAWIVSCGLSIALWWQWRAKRIIAANSDHNYDSAVYWHEQAQKERTIYDNLIADLCSDRLQVTLEQVFAWGNRRNRGNTRKQYRKSR